MIAVHCRYDCKTGVSNRETGVGAGNVGVGFAAAMSVEPDNANSSATHALPVMLRCEVVLNLCMRDAMQAIN